MYSCMLMFFTAVCSRYPAVRYREPQIQRRSDFWREEAQERLICAQRKFPSEMCQTLRGSPSNEVLLSVSSCVTHFLSSFHRLILPLLLYVSCSFTFTALFEMLPPSILALSWCA
jgi:hypothetical protein